MPVLRRGLQTFARNDHPGKPSRFSPATDATECAMGWWIDHYGTETVTDRSSGELIVGDETQTQTQDDS